jgi:hypothetical protein
MNKKFTLKGEIVISFRIRILFVTPNSKHPASPDME